MVDGSGYRPSPALGRRDTKGGRHPPLAEFQLSKSSGGPPKLQARHRKLRRLSEASEAHRSFGASPILRSLTDPSEPHRSFGGPPILRRLTDPSERHRKYGAPPSLRRLTAASEAHRSFGAPPILRRPTAAAERRRCFGGPPRFLCGTEKSVSPRR